MATNEATFKRELREAVKSVYGSAVHMWNTTDRFNKGIPDTCLTYSSVSMGWEAKFITELPLRDTSRILKHEVSGPQLSFLRNNAMAGGVGVVVLGSEDDALFLPSRYIDQNTGNITKTEFLCARDKNIRVQKTRGIWRVEGLLECLCGLKGVL